MSLVGAFSTVMGSILLPCLCYLNIYGAFLSLGFELGGHRINGVDGASYLSC